MRMHTTPPRIGVSRFGLSHIGFRPAGPDRRRSHDLALTLTGALFTLVCLATPSHGVTQIRRSVVGSGATGSAATAHAVRSTMGQPVVGHGSGVTNTLWSGFWTPPQTPAGLADADLIPLTFELYPGAPNPFSDLTTIRYDVPARGGAVVLRVYDITGRLVRSLVDGTEAPGRHMATWDGRNEMGARAAPGIYLVTFRAPGTSKSVKLVQMGGIR